jgi:hypothetical protein
MVRLTGKHMLHPTTDFRVIYADRFNPEANGEEVGVPVSAIIGHGNGIAQGSRKRIRYGL